MGGGGRLGGDNVGLEWVGVFSGWIHWLMRGIIDGVEEFLLENFERDVVWIDFDVISLFDFERLRVRSLVFIGDVEHVRIFLFDRRKLSWNEDERIKFVFDILKRSIKSKKKLKFHIE